VREAYRIRKGRGPPERTLNLKEPSSTATTAYLKIETTYTLEYMSRKNITIRTPIIH
jgi:hypothetical protein